MNSIRNKVLLIGNLGQDPAIKKFENGKEVVRFRLATNESYHDSEGKKVTETQWHNLVAWGGLARTIEKYLNKGSEVAVEGKLTHRTFEDKDGNKRYFTEVVLTDMMMLHSKNAETE